MDKLKRIYWSKRSFKTRSNSFEVNVCDQGSQNESNSPILYLILLKNKTSKIQDCMITGFIWDDCSPQEIVLCGRSRTASTW